MMKYIFSFLIAFGFVVAGTASASLWGVYQEQGLSLPSVEERAVDYALIADDVYTGTSEQNNRLEAYFRAAFGTDQALGATLPVAGVTYTLSGAGITSSVTSITLQSLTIPQTGYELLDADFSDTFYITLEPGNRKRQEIASCTTVTQNANDTATLSGCIRGLTPFTPFTASSAYRFSHGGGTSVIFSDPPQLFNEFAAKGNIETITALWSFDVHPRATSTLAAPTALKEYATVEYANNVAVQGSATSTESVAGISELATRLEMASGTLWGVIDPHVIQSQYATTTCETAGNNVTVTQTDGKLGVGCLDLSEQYAFTNSNGTTFTSSTNSGAITLQGSVLINGDVETTGANTIASSTITNLTINGIDGTQLVDGSVLASNIHSHASSITTGVGTQVNSSNATQTITHNLGSTPSYIQIFASSVCTGATADGSCSSVGTATSTASQFAVHVSGGGGSEEGASGFSSGKIIYLEDSGGVLSHSGTLTTINATTFVIDWNSADSAGDPRSYIWTAYK